MNIFCKKLKNLRTLNNITQQELANYLQIGKTTISNYETGYSFPDVEILTKLAEYFNCSIDYLLGRTDIKKSTDTVEDDPELIEVWKELKERDDLQLLFKQTKSLSPKSIKQIIRIIKAIEDEEGKLDE